MATTLPHDVSARPPRRATIKDWLAIPEELRAELINGQIVYQGMPGPVHGRAQGKLIGRLSDPFDCRPGSNERPGGWWLSIEVDLDLAGMGCRPDVLGWRRDRHPAMPAPDARGVVTTAPDWICEVLSKSTARIDVGAKREGYHRAGVEHYWQLDPQNGTLTILQWTENGYLVALTAGRGESVRAAPFEAVLLDVGHLLGDNEDDEPTEPPPEASGRLASDDPLVATGATGDLLDERHARVGHSLPGFRDDLGGIRTSSPEPGHTAHRLAERLIQLLDRGDFTVTYRYAVLVALMDLCMELTSVTGLPPDMITTWQLAEKVIELYWPQCAPYDERGLVLRQVAGKYGQDAEKREVQAEIIRHILEFRQSVDASPAASLSLARARVAAPSAYDKLARLVEWKLIEMPLARLQRIGREEDRFLYEYAFDKDVTRSAVGLYQQGNGRTFDNRLLLKPGVSAALVALSGVLRPLIYRDWTVLVAKSNGMEESRLEDFLFGADRISLVQVRPHLRDLQDGRCFYCGEAVAATCHVDHFVPWARHADDSIDNLVAAHEDCNGRKSDFLAAAEHVERWRERSTRHAATLAGIARSEMLESRPQRTFGVARSIYRMLPDDARLWRSEQDFIVIERPRIVAALAA